jgi:hypothetical protein
MATINNIEDLKNLLSAADQNGTLLTPKHDPNVFRRLIHLSELLYHMI